MAGTNSKVSLTTESRYVSFDVAAFFSLGEHTGDSQVPALKVVGKRFHMPHGFCAVRTGQNAFEFVNMPGLPATDAATTRGTNLRLLADRIARLHSQRASQAIAIALCNGIGWAE